MERIWVFHRSLSRSLTTKNLGSARTDPRPRDRRIYENRIAEYSAERDTTHNTVMSSASFRIKKVLLLEMPRSIYIIIMALSLFPMPIYSLWAFSRHIIDTFFRANEWRGSSSVQHAQHAPAIEYQLGVSQPSGSCRRLCSLV
jgi:hypothetical protein